MAQSHSGDPLMASLGLLVVGLFAAVPVLIGYMAFRRRYHDLIIVASALASLLLCGFLMTFLDQIKIEVLMEWARRHRDTFAGRELIGLLGLLRLCVVVLLSIRVAAWFFRTALGWAGRRIYGAARNEMSQ